MVVYFVHRRSHTYLSFNTRRNKAANAGYAHKNTFGRYNKISTLSHSTVRILVRFKFEVPNGNTYDSIKGRKTYC